MEHDKVPPSFGRPRCCACGQPVRVGEPHWAGDGEGRPWHYGCAEKAGLTLSWVRLRAARALAPDGLSEPAPAAAPG